MLDTTVRTRLSLASLGLALAAIVAFISSGASGCASNDGTCGGASVFCDDGGGADASDDGANNDETPILPGYDSGSNEGGQCAAKCSSDLHSVTDCNGVVTQTCSGDNGCDISTATCTNACQAAVNNKQSVGCEYYATQMDQYGGPTVCFVAFVANTWNTAVHINVDFNGQALSVGNFAKIPSGFGQSLTYQPFNAQAGLAPGQVAILFLGGTQGANPECPAPTAMGTAGMLQGTGIGHSFHITTDVPVVAYEMNPYGGGNAAVTGASLLLPVSSWDTNYVANTASPDTVGGPSINVIAAQDGTTVTMLPSVALTGGNGLPSGAANTQVKFNLKKGEQAQFIQQADLVGSILQSNKPIGLMAGNPCMNMPQGTIFCDHGEQMVPPVRALGSEYVGVMYRGRTSPNDPTIWRVIGAVDGTTLTYTPQIAGAPKTLKRGQMVEFITGTPFVIKSQDDQHPFELFDYMSGSNWSQLAKPNGYGDPDLSVIVPPQQYLSNYVIMTDPSYPETNLVIIRRKDENGNFKDVTLDCAGVLTGWTKVGEYEFTRPDLSTGDFKPVGKCSNGRHELKSDAPFGVGVWGWGTPDTSSFTANVSYSYPGGMNVQPINTVVIPPTPN
jgi:IgGFc binding protein